LFVGDALGRAGGHLRVQRGRRLRLSPLSRYLGVLELVLGVARAAARLLHIDSDHRDDRVVRDPALARTVVIQNVTKPKLTLLLH
jgi:hypothetical protein